MTLTFVLVLLVKVTLVLIGGAIAAAATRRAAAAVRHAIWMGALASTLILPALTIGMPTWRLHVMPARPIPAQTREQPTPARPYGNSESALRPLAELPSGTAPTAVDHQPAPIRPQQPARDGERSLPATTILQLIWLLGVTVGCVRLLMGRLGLRQVQRKAHPLTTNEWTLLLREERIRTGITRPISLLLSSATSTPVTWATRRPVILLPEAARTWTDTQRRVALRHELAHVARNDAAAQFAASVACTIYWFHPLAWLAAGRMRAEGERACDARVVALGTSPTDYAAQLLEIARSARALGDRGLISVAMARPSQLEQRVTAILFEQRTFTAGAASTGRGAFGHAQLMTSACAALLIVPLAMMQPSTRQSAPPARPAPLRAATIQPAAPGIKRHAAITPPRTPSEHATPTARHAVSKLDTLTMSWSDGSSSGSVRVEGQFSLTADGKDIAALSPGGLFAIKERRDGTTRRVEIRADTADSLRRTWIVNGAARPYDHEGEEWLADALTTFRRRLGFRSLWSDNLNRMNLWLDRDRMPRPLMPLQPLAPRRLVPGMVWPDTLLQSLRKAQLERAKLSRLWGDSLRKQLMRQQWQADTLARRMLMLQRKLLSDTTMRIRRWPDSLWTDSLRKQLLQSARRLDSLARDLDGQAH